MYSLNYLPTFKVSVFEHKNIKHSSKCMNCEIKRKKEEVLNIIFPIDR